MRSWNTDVTRPYVRALEARNLRHVLVGGSSFHRREEVAALRTALGAIERPDDTLAVFATLRGPLFALADGELLAYRAHVGRGGRLGPLHPFHAPPPDVPAELAEVVDALAVLRELHRNRNRRPFADTIARLLGAVRAHAGLAIWPAGEQALANVTRLMDLARRAERRGVVSFRAFVEHLEHDAERGEAGGAPIVEDGTEGVRIMTVHRAKGLEFPVVILADLTANRTPDEARRFVDPERGLCALQLAGASPPDLVAHGEEERARDDAESVRLLYVAATRARDLLVVPAVGDEEQPNSWLAPLDPAVRPPADRARVPESKTPAGCPKLEGDCVVDRPDNAERPAASVAPGLHRPRAGQHGVVWWAPGRLRLDVEENVGLKQKRLLELDESNTRSEAGIRAHADWQTTRGAVRTAAGTPSLRIATATEHAAAGDGTPDVAVEQAAAGIVRPHGARFGTLVHAMLATVDLAATADDVADVATVEGRLVGATPEEVTAATACVTAALAHPLVRRAAGAARLERETPLAMVLDDGTLVEGVVDAAFEDGDGWTVVDFKTDVELAGRLAEYRRQVALYASAIARATGKPARGVLLRV
jgi:ATP-dependent exoDNAse (exonuclease V) beta subunit